jgi:hypothetical protein
MVSESVPKRAVTVTIAIVGMLVLAAFFLIVYGNAQRDIESTQMSSEADCQALCQELLTTAFGYDTCQQLMDNSQAQRYVNECFNVTGACSVTIKQSITCLIQ